MTAAGPAAYPAAMRCLPHLAALAIAIALAGCADRSRTPAAGTDAPGGAVAVRGGPRLDDLPPDWSLVAFSPGSGGVVATRDGVSPTCEVLEGVADGGPDPASPAFVVASASIPGLASDVRLGLFASSAGPVPAFLERAIGARHVELIATYEHVEPSLLQCGFHDRDHDYELSGGGWILFSRKPRPEEAAALAGKLTMLARLGPDRGERVVLRTLPRRGGGAP